MQFFHEYVVSPVPIVPGDGFDVDDTHGPL